VKIKVPEFIVDKDDAFKNDKLERYNSSVLLTNLINSYDRNSVIALNSKWGTGKSTFIKMWSQELQEKNGYKTICLNAWENDYSNDVLPFLISEIGNGIDGFRAGRSSHVTLDGLKEAATYLLKATASGAIKMATLGAIDASSEYETIMSEAAAKIASEQIDDYLNAKNQLTKFKAKLEESINEITKDKPLVLFVDELDRCRPLFAIEVLEKIKHFFNLNNIIFIISIDKQQLGCSISSVYGRGIDTEGYLRRFFDIEYSFPSVSNDKYINYLIEKYDFTSYFSPRMKDICIKVSHLFSLDLRTIEQLFSQLSISIRVAKKSDYYCGDFLLLLVFLLMLKVYDENIYSSYVKNSDSDKVVNLLSNLDNNWFFSSQLGIDLAATIITATRKEGECHNYRTKLVSTDSKEKSIEWDLTGDSQRTRLDARIIQLVSNDMFGYLDTVFNKINMIGDFKIDNSVS